MNGVQNDKEWGWRQGIFGVSTIGGFYKFDGVCKKHLKSFSRSIKNKLRGD